MKLKDQETVFERMRRRERMIKRLWKYEQVNALAIIVNACGYVRYIL